MKQSKNYQLNLIETSDTFSPDPLNENMEKIETALDAARTEAKAATDAVATRVTTLEGHKTVWGTYTGNGVGSRTVSLGFTPSLLLVRAMNANSVVFGVALPNHTFGTTDLVIVDGGFTVTVNSSSFNTDRTTYAYIAFT